MKFIKKHIDVIGKIVLTLYLFYGTFVLASINVSSLKYPLELFIVYSVQISYNASIAVYLFFFWFRNKKEENQFRNIIIVTTVFIIASFPVSYGILIFGRNLSQFEGIQIGTADGWLAFIGSLLGGVITMLAVIFTINHEKSIRKEEEIKRLEEKVSELMPILNFSFKTIENDQIVLEQGSSLLISKLINVSSQHAIINKMKIVSYTYLFEGKTIKKVVDPDKEDSFIIQYFEDQILAGNSTNEFFTNIPLIDEMIEIFHKDASAIIDVTFIVEIEYTDIQKLQKYQYGMIRSISIRVNTKGTKAKLIYRLLRINPNASIIRI